MDDSVFMKICKTDQNLLCVLFCKTFWQFLLWMRLIISLNATSREVLEVDAELIAYNFTADVFYNGLVIQFSIQLDLFLY